MVEPKPSDAPSEIPSPSYKASGGRFATRGSR
jgi:hypothetical protein